MTRSAWDGSVSRAREGADTARGRKGVVGMQNKPSLPLEGVRILDLARLGPGPHSSQILADFGADIVESILSGRAGTVNPGAGDIIRYSPLEPTGGSWDPWPVPVVDQRIRRPPRRGRSDRPPP